MTTTTSPAANGRQQKSLAHQLDRLDTILDGLAEALNESVAEAVRDAVAAAVREAVEVALKEVLSRPELLRAALAAHGGPAAGAAEPATGKASVGRRLTRAWGGLSAWAWGALAWVGQAQALTKRVLARVRGRATTLARAYGKAAAGVAASIATGVATAARAAWRWRVRLVTAVAAGLAAGTVGFWAGPAFVAADFGLT